MKVIKWAWRLIFVGLLVLSISLNVAMFVGGMLYNAASSAFHAMTGLRPVAMQHADEVAELTSEVAQERAAKRKLRAELADTSSDIVTYRGQKVALKDAVNRTAERVSKRAAATSAREVTSMAGEALPYVGIAVVVGATALELRDLCDTMKDMSELQRALDPNTRVSDEEKTVCAQRVPTRDELWAAVKSSPGTAWAKARSVLPSLEEIKEYELPDIDWGGAWASAIDGADKSWEATKTGSSSALKATKDGVGVVVDGLINFWSDNDLNAVE